jgi:hypothetical protein
MPGEKLHDLYSTELGRDNQCKKAPFFSPDLESSSKTIS